MRIKGKVQFRVVTVTGVERKSSSGDTGDSGKKALILWGDLFSFPVVFHKTGSKGGTDNIKKKGGLLNLSAII